MKWRLLSFDGYLVIRQGRCLEPLHISNHIISVSPDASNLCPAIMKHKHSIFTGDTTIVLKTISALVLL